MGIISVDNIEPGMVLAEKVLTSKRMMLLPEGTILSEGHLLTFKTWGISEVNIAGEDNDEDGAGLSPEEKEALREEISLIFKFNQNNGVFSKELFQLACDHAEVQK